MVARNDRLADHFELVGTESIEDVSETRGSVHDERDVGFCDAFTHCHPLSGQWTPQTTGATATLQGAFAGEQPGVAFPAPISVIAFSGRVAYAPMTIPRSRPRIRAPSGLIRALIALLVLGRPQIET